MTAITSDCTFRENTPALGIKEIVVITPATAAHTNTIAVDLAKYGIGTVLGVDGYEHSTTDSIIIKGTQTTAVATGTLTITIGGSAGAKKRVYTVLGI